MKINPVNVKKSDKRLIADYRENIPNLHKGAYRRTYDKAINKQSMRAAVNAKCLDCCCWQATEIRDCGIPACPLYPYRPYKPLPSGSQDTVSARQKATGGDSGKRTVPKGSPAGVS